MADNENVTPTTEETTTTEESTEQTKDTEQEQEEATVYTLYGANLFGRKEITTGVDAITRQNLVRVLGRALAVHHVNSQQIDYLYNYMKGKQPVLNRKKKIRPEICNKIVENHASEIVQFTSGYFLGEPVTYVRRGDRKATSAEITRLNDYMFYEDKASHDKDLATWMAIGGVGYRMVLPDKDAEGVEDDSPFEIDTLDPRETFVVYHSGFGHKRMMAVQEIWREKPDGSFETLCCGYTKTHYFEVLNGTSIKKWQPHALGDIPIFEYRLNMSRMGCFEAAVPLLDAINNIMSNRVDGIEQFIQSFLKFINCDVDTDTVDSLRKIMASGGRRELRQALKRALDLMAFQVRQHADNLTDETRREVFERAGVDEVKWNTQHDVKVCGECNDRDGMIYPIDAVPDKHYRCRCYLTAVHRI